MTTRIVDADPRLSAFACNPAGPVAGVVRARSFRGGGYAVDVEAGGQVLDVHLAQAPPAGEEVRLSVDPGGVSPL